MMKVKIILLFTFISILMISCGGKKGKPEESDAQLTAQEETELFNKAKSMFGALPDKMPGSENDTPELIALGEKLYHETKLSVNNTQSCNTCHDLTNNMAGVDNEKVSPGAVEGTMGVRNSPTVLNAGFQFVQFWDGRTPDLVEQAKGPILNPIEMGMKSEKDVEKVFSGMPEYVKMFKKAFPGEKNPVTFDNVAKAIAAFERTLISRSRYDQWIAGNKTALTAQEKEGLMTFMDVNCTMCHMGPLFGGNIYQKMGLVKPYKDTKDLGRYEVTKNEADKYMFKVPMLRNAALTQPYFHDGGVETLKEAIKTMSEINLNLPQPLTDEQIADIEAFIKALTDTELEKAMK